jgi:V/A-type H+-transporting ATPase subunit C
MARCDRVNATVGALRARLLGRAGVRALLARPDHRARVAFLRDADAALGRELAADASPADVEEALARRARADALRLLALVEGDRARELFRAVLLVEEARGLAALLQRIARAHGGRAAELLAPSAWFGPVLVERLAAAADLAGAAAALEASGSPFAAAARAAQPRQGRPAAALRLDAALAGAAFDEAFRLASGHGEDAAVARRVLAARVDLANAATLLAPGVRDRPALLLPRGRVPLAALARLEERPPARVAAELARLLGAAWDADVDAAALAVPLAAERHLEALLVAGLRRAARARPLSIAVPLAYAAARLAEARDVGLAVRAAEARLPPPQLAALLEAA